MTNTGVVAGAAVPELYVSDTGAAVPRPAEELKGFSKVFLNAGESRTVVLPLTARSFSYYDVVTKKWHAHSGNFGVLVGSSPDQIELRGQVALDHDLD